MNEMERFSSKELLIRVQMEITVQNRTKQQFDLLFVVELAVQVVEVPELGFLSLLPLSFPLLRFTPLMCGRVV